MTKKAKISYISGGAIVLIIILFVIFRGSSNTSYTTSIAQKADISAIVSVTGNVKPANDLSLSFQSSGRIFQIKTIVGADVKKNDELARLDMSDLSIQLAQAQAGLDIAQAKLDQLLSGSSAEEIQVAQTTLDNAKSNYEKEVASSEQNLSDVKIKAENDLSSQYTTALNYLDLASISVQNSLNTAKSILDDTNVNSFLDTTLLTSAKDKKNFATNSYNATEPFITTAENTQAQSDIDIALSKMSTTIELTSDYLTYVNDALYASIVQGGLTKSTLDSYKSSVATIRTSINTSKTNISGSITDISSQKSTNSKNINSAQNSLDTTKTYWQTQIDSAQKNLELTKAPVRDADKNLYEAQVRQAKTSVDEVRDKISKSILRSPIDGKISKVDIKVGEQVLSNQSIISVINTQSFDIEADIPESEIGRLNISNKVNISYDAFPNENKVIGTLAQIDPAEKTVEGVIYYKITVILDNPDERLRSGLTANLDIIAAQKSQVITIPQRAVIAKKGLEKIVKILENNKTIKEVKVSTGLMGENGEIEITSGINVGDVVVISEQNN